MTKMEVLHLDYRPGTAGWGLRLQSRLQGSSSAALRERYQQWQDVGLGELGMAVATRLSLILRVSYRLGELLKNLRDEVEESGDIDDLIEGGYVYVTKDSRIFYDICVAVDAFYFEFRSCYEVIGRYVHTFGKEILGTTISENDILEVLSNAGVDTEWIDPLRENRKLFFHQTAPWIALEIHQRHPLECSLIVMKENLQEFDDTSKYIRQEDLVAAVGGLQKAVSAIHDWLHSRIEKFEESESKAR